jgi:hypothetical protein
MGHDLPPVFWERIADLLAENARRADQATATRATVVSDR